VPSSLRILMLEDDPADAELLSHALHRAGLQFEVVRVESEAAYLEALHEHFDLVMSDYRLPGFDGLKALRHLQERGLDIPLIIVTGALGDELAVECIKRGVADCLLKDRLARLGVAIEQALEKQRQRVERGQLETQYRQAQKMEAVGRLASGVAHDFNNLLTVISGYSQLILSTLPEGQPVRQDVEQIQAAAMRAQTLTRQLLAFSRRQILEVEVVDVNALIVGLEKLLGRLIPANIRLRVQATPDIGQIKTDRGQIEQVLMNLVINAGDAMPEGGDLTIGTTAIHLERGLPLRTATMPAGEYVGITIQDTGTGITPEVQAHLFEPFFTTKGPGKGTGLGLSTVYGIVKQSGGYIDVSSELKRGTIFSIYLPRTTESPAPAVRAEPVTRVLQGTETILMVEDSDLVRSLARRILTSQGYTVIEAATGEEAIELARTSKQPIHLFLINVVLPGISGAALGAELTRLHPESKVLYVSGYADETLVAHGIVEGRWQYLPKPYAPEVLARKVRDVIDQHPGPET
jgi:two-component system cell cycle sensor histidine kinase/response regulator CckA